MSALLTFAMDIISYCFNAVRERIFVDNDVTIIVPIVRLPAVIDI
jgi:hypothetical protein